METTWICCSPIPGTFEFGYIVTNNFGCTWDTTLTVEVIDNPGTFITAGPDQIFCSNPVTLLAPLTTEGSPVVWDGGQALTRLLRQQRKH